MKKIFLVPILISVSIFLTACSHDQKVSDQPQTDNQITPSEQPATQPSGTNFIVEFNKSVYEQARSSDKLIVLYFYANWCPICREEFPKMQEAFNELDPDRVVGIRVNYNDDQTDNDEKELAREFGVAYQHTKVFLKNGERVLKSPESWERDRYIEEINKIIK